MKKFFCLLLCLCLLPVASLAAEYTLPEKLCGSWTLAVA